MIRFRDPAFIRQLAFTADGRHLVTVLDGQHYGEEAFVSWWDWSRGERAHRVAADGAGISPDAGFVALYRRRRGRVVVRRGPDGGRAGGCDVPGEVFSDLAVSPDGAELLIDAYPWLHVRELPSGQPRLRKRVLLSSIRYSPGGRWLTGRGVPTAEFFDRSRAWAKVELPAAALGTGLGTAAAVAPDDRTAAVIGPAVHLVVLWDLPTEARLRTLRGHRRSVTAVAFSPDGRRLLSCALDGTVREWAVASGECLRVFDWGLPEPEYLAWSPAGTTCAAADHREVVVWDAEG